MALYLYLSLVFTNFLGKEVCIINLYLHSAQEDLKYTQKN